MQDPDVQSPHRLVEFLAAISRCQDCAGAMRCACELIAEEFDAEVGAVVLGQTVCATVGFGQRGAPHAALASIVPGTGSITLDGIGTCHSLAAVWNAGTRGRLLVARVKPAFVSQNRNLLLGMAGALGMALDMIGVLERERGRQRVLEVLLEIQRSISHRAPLSTILAAVTDGASTVLRGCPVSLLLDDALDPERPIVAGADLTRAVATVSAAVHINGVPAGALVAATQDGAPVGSAERSLLHAFAEHASLALTDARTVEAMQEAFRDPLTELPNPSAVPRPADPGSTAARPTPLLSVGTVHRSRPVQGGQRQPRTRGRRHTLARCCRADSRMYAIRCHCRPLRWRRVCAASAGLRRPDVSGSSRRADHRGFAGAVLNQGQDRLHRRHHRHRAR